MMLQQTRVESVVAYFQRFLRRFPTLDSLAAASQEEVLKLWSGLGYYRRARQLHQASRRMAGGREKQIPSTYKELIKLPGVGRYTAGAIASIAFGEPVPALDGNVMRVLTRLLALPDDLARQATRNKLQQIAATLVPEKNPGDYNQAMMELGATLCTPRHPACGSCPLPPLSRARDAGNPEKFPVKAARGKAPRVKCTSVVVRQNGKWLLLRRPAGGLWEHLWEFPTLSRSKQDLSPAEVQRRIGRMLGLDAQVKSQDIRLRHQLTHRRMEYRVFAATAIRRPKKISLPLCGPGRYEAYRWVADLDEVPVAGITRKILEEVRANLITRRHGKIAKLDGV